MNYPLKSFLIAFVIWLATIFLLVENFLKNSEIIPVSLEIEALGSLIKKHSNFKTTNKNNSSKEKEHDLSSDNKEKSQQALEPIYQPLPAIPDELRNEAFNSFAIARFYINKAGDVENVELIKASANPKLNQLLLKSLKKWKFSASNSNSSKDIKVNFEVK
jgi:TonB family protein